MIENMNDEFVYDPVKGESERITLTKSGSAWLVIDRLPTELMKYSDDNYDELFDLHPDEMGKVMMENTEVTSFRWHQSYMNTPRRQGCERSYMFCGLENANINDPLPGSFVPFLAYMNQGKDFEYNQVVANWYQHGEDYIANHSDYTDTMIEGYAISSISLNEPSVDKNAQCRVLKFKPRAGPETDRNDALYRSVDIIQRHGTIVTMCGNTQAKFTHGVPKITVGQVPSRISLSFRQFK